MLETRREEESLEARLAGSGWHVKFGGDSKRIREFRPLWDDKWTHLRRRRPLALKKSENLTAWLFKYDYDNFSVCGVQVKNADYPHLFVGRKKKILPWCPWPRPDPWLVQRFPEVARGWAVYLYGNTERAAPILADLEDVLADTEVREIHMRGEFVMVASRRYTYGQDALLKFAAEAARVIEAAGVPNLFAGDKRS